jgi:hypothetical protein
MLYNFVLLPLVMIGGGGIMLCFVVLLPGVGNWLVAVFGAVMGDKALQARRGQTVWTQDP